MQIFLRQPSGDISTLIVSSCDTAHTIKTKYVDLSRLETESQRLTFAGRSLCLRDDFTLADYNIQDGCTLNVALRLRGGMMTQPLPAPPDTAELAQKKNERAAFNLLHPGKIQIAIKTQSEFSIMLILDPGQSVKRLKEKIEDEAQIPVENQRLLFGGASLDDDRTVGDYGVSHGNTILLSTSVVPRLPQTIETLDKLTVQDEVQIFVRNLNGKTMAIMISPSDTVDRLHELVFERTGIPTSEQRLLYGGKQLEAGRLLSDYGILKESTLHLVLRLRGGLLTRQTRPARRLSRPRI